MKLRPIIILLLFVASLGILAWVYYTASYNHSQGQNAPWRDVVVKLSEYGRTKHAKAMQYAQFADIADIESEADAASLFRALAFSEQVHEQNCAEAIRRLGGEYTAPPPVPIFKGKTADNLSRSLAFEQRLHENGRKSDIDRALQAGNRYAARVLIWADGSDLQHICLLKCCLRIDHPAPGYMVCPTCGNLYRSDLAAHYCPFCQTSAEEFVSFK